MTLGLTKNSWLFALKTTIAAICALYIALAFDLNNPNWAVATVFIASQPFSSSTFSKGMYRVFGTFIGASVALFLVPNLIQMPMILCTALALWVSVCLFISLQDRSPKSYMFMLAGYTAVVIAFPSVSTPELIFNTVVDRVQEILIGVLSSAIVHGILFPNNIFMAVKGTIDRWVIDAYQLVGLSFDGKVQNGKGHGYDLLHNVASYPMNLERLADHLIYDGRQGRKQAQLVAHIQTSMRQLVPIVNSIYFRISLIGRKNLPEALIVTLDQMKEWIHHQDDLTQFHQIKTSLNDLKQQYGKLQSDQKNVPIYALIIRLQELIHFINEIHNLKNHLHNDQFDQQNKIPKKYYFVDQGLAFLSSLTVFLAIMVNCGLWILCGWDNVFAAMPMMAGIACCLFATFDSALPSLKIFLNCTIISVIIVIFYTVMVLPDVNSFETLFIVLIPLFMVLGLFMTVPSTAFISMILAISLASLMGLKNEYYGNFLSTLNGGLASVCGVGIAIFMMYTFRSKSPIWVAKKIEMYALKDIISTIKKQSNPKKYWKIRERLINRMLDKVYQILPRVKNPTKKSLYEETNLLNDIRLGINLLDLKQFVLLEQDEVLKSKVMQLIEEILKYLEQKMMQSNDEVVDELLQSIDRLQAQYISNIDANQLSVVLYNTKISLFSLNHLDQALYIETVDLQEKPI